MLLPQDGMLVHSRVTPSSIVACALIKVMSNLYFLQCDNIAEKSLAVITSLIRDESKNF